MTDNLTREYSDKPCQAGLTLTTGAAAGDAAETRPGSVCDIPCRRMGPTQSQACLWILPGLLGPGCHAHGLRSSQAWTLVSRGAKPARSALRKARLERVCFTVPGASFARACVFGFRSALSRVITCGPALFGLMPEFVCRSCGSFRPITCGPLKQDCCAISEYCFQNLLGVVV